MKHFPHENLPVLTPIAFLALGDWQKSGKK
jgi:hypothetical protein